MTGWDVVGFHAAHPGKPPLEHLLQLRLITFYVVIFSRVIWGELGSPGATEIKEGGYRG